jgi:hypothetical protein
MILYGEKPHRLHKKKMLKTNNQVQWCCRIQNQQAKLSSIAIHQ